MALIFHWAEKLSRGCSLFALMVGIGLGYAFGFFLQQRSFLEPTITHQLLTHVLFGHLPTFLVSAFILLRVSFQLSTDEQSRVEWTSTQQLVSYAVGCALVCVLVWAWFFLSSMIGFWLGLMHASNGYAKPIWNAFWFDFDLNHLLHASFRMTLLAASLSVMTFVETSFLRARRNELGTLMSRFMIFGMVMIVGIELVDMSLM